MIETPKIIQKMDKVDCKHGLNRAFCALCNPRKDVEFSLRLFARRYSDLTSVELASKALERMTDSQQHRLLLSLLRIQFDNFRRSDARTIEKEASSSWEREKKERDRERQIRYREDKREREVFEQEKPWTASYGKIYESWSKLNPAVRKLRLQREAPEYLAFLENKGSDDYLYSYPSYSVEKAFKDFEHKVKKIVTLEITEELLGSSFSVSDSKSVTWGEATVADHQTRINLLLAQAGGTVSTAKLHREAIQILTERRLNKLNDVNSLKTSIGPQNVVVEQQIERKTA